MLHPYISPSFLLFKSTSKVGRLNLSFAPNTISTPSISEIDSGFSWAKHPVTTTKELGDFFLAFRIILLHSLFAFSVTEQVLITNKSAPSLNSFFTKPISFSCLAIVEVSEKLSLQPKV